MGSKSDVIEIMDRIDRIFPLSYTYHEDGRDVWPSRWAALRATFEKHTHVVGDYDGRNGNKDTCLYCGKDIRDDIHLRMDEEVDDE